MTLSDPKFLRFFASTAVLIGALFGFYVMSFFSLGRILPTSPLTSVAINIGPSLDSLFLWAGSAVAGIVIAILVFIWTLMCVAKKSDLVFRAVFALVAILSAAGATMVLLNGSVVAESALMADCRIATNPVGSLCDSKDLPISDAAKDKGKAYVVELNGSEFLMGYGKKKLYSTGILAYKIYLNLFLQTATIAILTTMIALAACRRFFGDCDIRDVRNSFFLASLVLTTVVITDVLFFEFIKASTKDASLISLQRGLLYYIAIISSMTLFLGLAFSSIVGRIPLNLASAGAVEKGEAKPMAYSAERVLNFLKSPGLATAIATLAPLLTVLLPPGIGSNG